MRACRGFTLVIALVVLALTSVLALGAAQHALFGLRMANGGQARLELLTAAENGLERRLARGVPAGAGLPPENLGGTGAHRVEVEIRRHFEAGRTVPPLGGYAIGVGRGTFVAEHYVAHSVATDARGARAVLEQQFHLVLPGAR
jgi:hypothetical protein